MKMNHLAFATLLLTACSHDPVGVRLTHEAQPAAITATAKTEPVFYNGKTYQVSFTPAGDGNATLSIAGMSAAQAKDASQLATSTFHHFACKDSQKAVLTAPPTFDGAGWKATGHCV